jgi:hypothetical protein
VSGAAVGFGHILDADRLLQQAVAQTGLDDFGDPSLPERVRIAVDYLRGLRLGDAALESAAEVALGLLRSRLEFFEDFKRYPIAGEVIEKPIFATGEGRSGTTLLHALLSVDPRGRSLRFWEVMNPSPPPGVIEGIDPRRARADADWRDINARMPNWLISHPYNDMLGDGLPECERTWAFDFRVLTPTAWWRVPIAPKFMGLPSDPAAQYRIHKMMLQQFQYRRPKKYWVLKGFHQPRLRALFDAYPDARIIWTHRDPIQVIASRIVLAGGLAEELTGHVDWNEEARTHREASVAGYLSAASDPLMDDPRIYHVRYKDLVADPVGTLRQFYETFDIPFDASTEGAMRDYLANNRSDRYGKLHYTTDIIGSDIAELNRRLEPYRDRFGLAVEAR